VSLPTPFVLFSLSLRRERPPQQDLDVYLVFPPLLFFFWLIGMLFLVRLLLYPTLLGIFLGHQGPIPRFPEFIFPDRFLGNTSPSGRRPTQNKSAPVFDQPPPPCPGSKRAENFFSQAPFYLYLQPPVFVVIKTVDSPQCLHFSPFFTGTTFFPPPGSPDLDEQMPTFLFFRYIFLLAS